MKHVKRTSSALCMGVLALFLPQMSKADTAIVIGVNQYKSLTDANLKGCVNDANSIVQVLKSRGFAASDIVLLVDEQATKQHILDAIHNATKGGRFVLYFAGHGTQTADNTSAILPSDSTEEGDNTIGKAELTKAVQGVTAQARTIVLDSCFADGAVRGKKNIGNKRSRFHELRDGSKTLPPGRTDDNTNIVGDSSFCSYVAGTRQQSALEESKDGEVHGLFTYYLTSRLKESSVEKWADAVAQVNSDVALASDQSQTPIFKTDEYKSAKIFGKSGGDPKPSPYKNSIWDVYNDTKTNPNYVSISSTLSQPVVAKGTKFQIQIATKNVAGYLAILNLDTKGNLTLFSPDPSKATTADEMVRASRVEAGNKRSIETEAKDIGREELKAIFFRTESDARKFFGELKKAEDGEVNGIKRYSPHKLAQGKKRLPNNGEKDDNGDVTWDYYTSLFQVTIE